MKKRLLALCMIVAAISSAVAQDLKFVDATTLKIYGYTQQTDKSPYYRFDHSLYGFEDKGIISHSKKSSGLYMVFKTNSSQISASWENAPHRIGDNMSGILQHGLDLYIKVNGKWEFAAVGRISTHLKSTKRTKSLVQNLPEGEKECLLYLPMWCEVTRLAIGVDNDATIEGLPSPFKHKVVVFGSSITHGASASRAGLTYTAQFTRNLGIDFVNFGFSGKSKLQPEFLECLKQCDADAFLFDAFSNPKTNQIEERLENFVAELVKAHPGKPFIFLQTPILATMDAKHYATRKERIDTTTRIMGKLTKQYKDVYFLDIENVLGKDGTIDGIHPNDIGFSRFVKSYQPKIAKILKKYKIKGN